MNKTLPLALFAAAALGVAFTVGSGASAETAGLSNADAPLGIGQQVAGAWLGVVDFGNGPFEAEMQFYADGNVAVNNTVISEGSTHLTTAFGAWKRSGIQAIAFTALIRIVDPNGELLSYEKLVGEVSIEGDSFSGPVAGLIYLPGMDPLDPTVDPVFVYGPAELTGERIGVAGLPE
jgi:hypothetical protein